MRLHKQREGGADSRLAIVELVNPALVAICVHESAVGKLLDELHSRKACCSMHSDDGAVERETRVQVTSGAASRICLRRRQSF